MILSVVAFLLRVTLLAVFTFGFVVLYEHGPSQFVSGCREEAAHLVARIDHAPSPRATN